MWIEADCTWSEDSKRYITSPNSIQQNSLFYIQEIGHFKTYKPYYTMRENFNSFLVKFTISGSGYLKYRNTEYVIKTGDIFFIDCKDFHHYATLSDEPWEMIWVHFHGLSTSDFFNMFNQEPNYIIQNKFDNIYDNPIYFVMRSLIDLIENFNATSNYTISLKIHELLNLILLQKYSPFLLDINNIPVHVTKIKNYIDMNINRTISLSDLEEICFINKYQIIKDFEKHIGISPINYLIDKKIEKSKEYLIYTKKSISEIASHLSISDSAYFSRLFKKRVGISPTLFRASFTYTQPIED